MQKKLHLYHTNDLHSYFSNWPKIASYIKSQHSLCTKRGEEYLTLDIGDHVDRAHIISEGLDGKGNVKLLNDLNYDYVTIGNNEGITFEYDALSNLYDEAKFKVVLANIKEKNNSQPSWAVPSHVHTTDSGLKIGIMGVTAPYYKYYELLGWRANDPIEMIQSLIKKIREKSDIVVLLSHLGLDQDRYIANEIDGIDIILGGHTHHLLQDGLFVNDTLISQAGRQGDYIGHIEVIYDDQSKAILKKKAQCVETSLYQDDKETVSFLCTIENQARKKLGNTIVALEEEIPVDWFSVSSPLSDLLADTIKEWCEADISMINAGVLLDGLPKGKITREYLHKILPHPINACKVHLKGDVLKEVVLHSFTKEMIHKRFRGLGFRGEVMGMMVYSGVEVQGRILEDNEFHVQNVIVNNELLDYDKEYSLATLDMFTFGSFYPSIVHNKSKTYYLPHMLRDLLAWKLKKMYKHR